MVAFLRGTRGHWDLPFVRASEVSTTTAQEFHESQEKRVKLYSKNWVDLRLRRMLRCAMLMPMSFLGCLSSFRALTNILPRGQQSKCVQSFTHSDSFVIATCCHARESLLLRLFVFFARPLRCRGGAPRYKDVFACADSGHRRHCGQTGECVRGAEAERSWFPSELRRAGKPRVRRRAPDAQRWP